MTFVHELARLDRHAECAGSRLAIATVPVTPNWARRVLRIKKGKPLVFGRFALRCIGSKHWRERQDAKKRATQESIT